MPTPPLFFPLVLFCCPAFSATMTPPLFFLLRSPPRPPRPVFLCFFCCFSPLPDLSPRSFVLLLSVPRALALCGCPPHLPPPPFFFFLSFLFLLPVRASLVSAFPLFPALGALGLGALSPPTPPAVSLSLSLFFCCCFPFPLFPGSGRSWCSWPLPRLAGFLFPPPCAALLVVCALRAGAVPPPPRRLLVFGCVSCLVLWCLGLLWAVLCGLWRFAVFFGALWCWCRAVWCLVVPYCAVFCRAWCRRALLCGVLCCVLLLAVSCGRCFPLFCWCRPVPCCAVLFCAVFCHAWCRRVLLSGVLRCVLSWCAVSSGRRVGCVVWGFPAFPPPSAAIAWSLVVARCCVLSWGAVPCWSVVPSVVPCAAVCVLSCWCRPVASFALAGAVCCCLWLLGVRCWVWLPAVVVRWCALARVVLPRRVARRPAVCFGSLWRSAPLCCVLCSVALCCRVVPCCGALLSVLLCSVVRVALCCSLAPSVVDCAFLCRVVFCAPVVSPSAVLRCRLGAVWCLVSLPVFVGGSGCLVLLSGGACLPWCPCLASGRPPCCLVCWCGVMRCPAPCAVSCGAVLRCGAVLSGCVVRLSMLLVFVFPFVFCKNPLLFLRTFENFLKTKKIQCFSLEG